MLSLEQGARLVKLARKAIESKFSLINLRVDKKLKEEFNAAHGCFVTLHKNGELRGCIGFPEPIMPVWQAVVEGAKHASFNDPRFGKVQKNELDEIIVEVSVLTKPKRVDVRNPGEYINKIRIGKDGLVIRGTFNSGLLLPQVAIEQEWDAATFLSQACLKANLKADEWNDFDSCRVYTFQSQVFSEANPKGEIIQIM